jgi:hypothetical protein
MEEGSNMPKADELRRKAEAEQRIPGTESYRAPSRAPVGRQAIEKDSMIGHDNLEAKSEIDKDMEDQGKTADGTLR